HHTSPRPTAPVLFQSSPLKDASATPLYSLSLHAALPIFAVSAASADAQSGIQKVSFPGVSGMSGGGDVTGSPYQTSYTWTGTTAASGAQTVTATNNAGLATTGSFTVVNDTTAPTGQTVAL